MIRIELALLLALIATAACEIDRNVLKRFLGDTIARFDKNLAKPMEALKTLSNGIETKMYSLGTLALNAKNMLDVFIFRNCYLLKSTNYREQVVDLHGLNGSTAKKFVSELIKSFENEWYENPKNKYLSAVYFIVGRGIHSTGNVSYNFEDIRNMLLTMKYEILETKNTGLIGVRLKNTFSDAEIHHNHYVTLGLKRRYSSKRFINEPSCGENVLQCENENPCNKRAYEECKFNDENKENAPLQKNSFNSNIQPSTRRTFRRIDNIM